MEEIYTDEIIALAGELTPFRSVKSPSLEGIAVSKVCGSRINVRIYIDHKGRIGDFSQQVKACLVGQASAALMARNILHASPEELVDIRNKIAQMLQEDTPPPPAPWQDYALLKPVQAYPSRFNAVLLPFDAIHDAVRTL